MDNFAGDKKVGQSILGPIETKFKNWAVPRLPEWVETYHLTMTTVLWSALNLLWGYLAGTHSLHWLWMVSLMIALQYVTDLFDGQLGRIKDTGLIKWGFFMDHFLDYVFLWSLVAAGYLISPAGLQFWYVVLLGVMGCFMVNSFLTFAATNEFEIFHFGIGPTETRIVFILINTIIIFTGTDHFTWSLPILVLVCLAALIFQVFRSHNKLWKIDEENKGGPIPPKQEKKPEPLKKEESAEEEEEKDPKPAEEPESEETPLEPTDPEEDPASNGASPGNDKAEEDKKEESDTTDSEDKPARKKTSGKKTSRKSTSRKKTTKKKTSGRKKTKNTESDE